ncbi:MAG: SusC/RagA family TonB-linked outer membrane protein, partial [Bacteroidales bacterium]|nr:SusC/RagA family TonB-linked outer membrane protein [Bacteroidales bacterium]
INPDGTPGASSQFVYNPYGLISKTGYRRLSNGNINANLRLNYAFKGFLEGLNAGIGGSINNEMYSYNNQIRPEFAVYSLSLPAEIDPSDTANINYLRYTKYNDDADPYWEYPSSNFQHKFFESYLNYDIAKGDHALHAMLRMQLDSYQNSGNHYVFSNASLGSRIHYSLKNKYIAEFTGGYHGMEQYPDGNRFGFFPAIGLGWILSRENFLVNNRFINYLKLRGSAGILGGSMSFTGNDVNSRIFHTQYYSRTSSVYFGETNQNEIYGITESTIANPMITWDKLRSVNAGIEGTFFNHLDLTLDYFDEYRYDILTINNQHPWVLGYGERQPYMNDAIIKNNGIEATVALHGSGNNFSYRVSGSLWSNFNEIIRNPAATLYKDAYRSEIGKRVGQIMGFETLGFFASDEEAQNAAVKQTFGQVGAGDVIYKDQNSDGIVDDLDKVAMGNSYVPEYTYALNIYLSYRNFSLSILGQGIIYSSFMMEGYFQPFNGYRNSYDYALERWNEANKESARYPRLSSVTNQNNSQPSDIWLRSLDYFKIRHAELGFDLPDNLINRIAVENFRIFVRGMNLFTWTKEIDFMDPEIMTGYPGMTSVTMGIKASF